MRRIFLKFVSTASVALGASAMLGKQALAADPVKVVYHLSEGLDQASRALANMRNHLRADSNTRIVVVAHGEGVRFLLEGARDRKNNSYDAAVGALVSQGVEFYVCNNTLTAHGIAPSLLLMDVKIVQSGVAEVARLQAREGFAYLHP
jgi:hypothetical protein